MPGIFEIKSRIEGLGSIYNITYAMQIVTISRLKRITNHLLQLKASLEEARYMLSYLTDRSPSFKKRLFNPPLDDSLPPVFVLFFSNRGFCGSFNQDILQTFRGYCIKSSLDPNHVPIICVGKKGSVIIKKAKDTSNHFFSPAKDLFSAEEVWGLYHTIESFFKENRKIFFVYFDFKSIISQKPVVSAFFPPSVSEFQLSSLPFKRGTPYVVEPQLSFAQDRLLSQYYFLKIFEVIRHSASSEFSQRFLLMKSAVDNVKTLRDELKMELNKERQRMITQEISEIISTFKSLKK